ncbi:hypothetical protein C1890_04835 [Pseudomonas sp. DP16D-R1]|nr:hypothetical protein C1890_04835 [Pseudomonas sp. DP16D-R1]
MQFLELGTPLKTANVHCGSWLASDGGSSFTINVDCAGAIAGKPAPTGIFIASTIGYACHQRSITRSPSSSP